MLGATQRQQEQWRAEGEEHGAVTGGHRSLEDRSLPEGLGLQRVGWSRKVHFQFRQV